MYNACINHSRVAFGVVFGHTSTTAIAPDSFSSSLDCTDHYYNARHASLSKQEVYARFFFHGRILRIFIATILLAKLYFTSIMPSVNCFVFINQYRIPVDLYLQRHRRFRNINFKDLNMNNSHDDVGEQSDDENDADDNRSEIEEGEPIALDDLDWRLAKARLEEDYIKRLIRSKPRFLPYKEARNWVQAWGGRWKTEKDWKEWISEGEKRNSYIPARPDEYYTRTGNWISWHHFLVGDDDND